MNHPFQDEINADDQTLPEPPDNPSFLDLSPEEQDLIEKKFQRGMSRTAAANANQARARALYERAAFDRSREVDRKRRNFEVTTRAIAAGRGVK